jgi:hypothetical protein
MDLRNVGILPQPVSLMQHPFTRFFLNDPQCLEDRCLSCPKKSPQFRQDVASKRTAMGAGWRLFKSRDTAMDLRVPYNSKVDSFLTKCVNISFSRRTLLRVIMQFVCQHHGEEITKLIKQ